MKTIILASLRSELQAIILDTECSQEELKENWEKNGYQVHQILEIDTLYVKL